MAAGVVNENADAFSKKALFSRHSWKTAMTIGMCE